MALFPGSRGGAGPTLEPLPPPFPAFLQVWEDGVSSEAGAVRLYASEIVGSLVEGLASAQWSRKKACAEAVLQLTKV